MCGLWTAILFCGFSFTFRLVNTSEFSIRDGLERGNLRPGFSGLPALARIRRSPISESEWFSRGEYYSDPNVKPVYEPTYGQSEPYQVQGQGCGIAYPEPPCYPQPQPIQSCCHGNPPAYQTPTYGCQCGNCHGGYGPGRFDGYNRF